MTKIKKILVAIGNIIGNIMHFLVTSFSMLLILLVAALTAVTILVSSPYGIYVLLSSCFPVQVASAIATAIPAMLIILMLAKEFAGTTFEYNVARIAIVLLLATILICSVYGAYLLLLCAVTPVIASGCAVAAAIITAIILFFLLTNVDY